MSAPGRIAVFGYGSLVSSASASETLGRPVREVHPAELEGWRRGFLQKRHNPTCEKTFARADGGGTPEWVLGLGIEPAPASSVNGALIELDEAEADRLDLRELRYLRRDVTERIRAEATFDRVFTYVARPEHRALTPPPDAVVLRSYLETVEAAFAELGAGQLERFRATTEIPAVETVDGVLVRDEIPPGNPRDW